MNNLFLIIQMLFPIAAIGQTFEQEILGVWQNEKKDGHIEFYEKNGKYFGKIVWAQPPDDFEGTILVDRNNPNPKLRNRPIMNMTVIQDLSFSNGEWKNGSAYSPEKGKSFDCKIWLTREGEMKVRGYWSIFYMTETWTRI